jgi:hypothetical protein
MILEAQPDQGLIDLVQTEYERQRGKEQLIVSTTEVPASVNPYRGYEETTAEITFWGEAHEYQELQL